MKRTMALTFVIWITCLLTLASSYGNSVPRASSLDGEQQIYLIAKSQPNADKAGDSSTWKNFSLASIAKPDNNLETNLDQLKIEQKYHLTKFSQNHAKLSPTTTEEEVGFITFEVSDYKHPSNMAVQQIAELLASFPDDVQILLSGHPYTRDILLPENLSQLRANTLKQKLVKEGINPLRIITQTAKLEPDHEEKILHGVAVYIRRAESSTPVKKATIDTSKGQIAVASDRHSFTQETLQVQQPEPKASEEQYQAMNINANTAAYFEHTQTPGSEASNKSYCKELQFKSGSLRANIEREINDCGYVMGRWVFGTENTLLDWYVPLGFQAQAAKGLPDLLTFIEQNYQIRAHVHQLDHSIDFLPSINQTNQVPSHAEN
jgi:outer membrane protein OmpA-like peptidoglycan-associated protein